MSKESNEQTFQRLLRVIAQADFKVYQEPYAFQESSVRDLPVELQPEALALIRDGGQWSQLVPASGSNVELFRIFRFHFAEALDNSGFVGWFATYLKQQIGTGIFVICGQNSNRGGIFDYWGCPAALAQSVIDAVDDLREQGRALHSLVEG